LARAEERAAQVDAEDVVPLRGGECFDGSALEDAGVEHHAVAAPRLGEQRFHLRLVRDVAAAGEPGTGHLRRRLRGADGDVDSVRDQRLRDGQPDPARGACDQRLHPPCARRASECRSSASFSKTPAQASTVMRLWRRIGPRTCMQPCSAVTTTPAPSGERASITLSQRRWTSCSWRISRCASASVASAIFPNPTSHLSATYPTAAFPL